MAISSMLFMSVNGFRIIIRDTMWNSITAVAVDSFHE